MFVLCSSTEERGDAVLSTDRHGPDERLTEDGPSFLHVKQETPSDEPREEGTEQCQLSMRPWNGKTALTTRGEWLGS